jgi:hypothetical protein
MDIVLECIGWSGAAAFVIAYQLVSSGRLKADDRLYQILNLGGAVAVGASVFPKEAWPAFGLQVIWGAIAIVSLIRICRKPRV